MKTLTVSLQMLARQIKEDKISGVMIGFPIIVAIGLYYFAPAISQSMILKYGPQWNLIPYYPMFDAIVIAFSFCTPAFASAMVMFSELDNKVVPSLCASPLGRDGYFFSRLIMPTLISLVLATILCFSFHLSDMSYGMYLMLIVVSLAACTLPGMIVIAFGRNKVEGVALFKISIFTTFAIIVPFFINTQVQWIFGFLPSFWIAKMIVENNYLFSIPALLITAIWVIPLWKRFMNKI